MNICFIEDTPLHGGTQIWVTEAVKEYINYGHKVRVLSPVNSWVFNECKKLGADSFGYDFKNVVHKSSKEMDIWKNALQASDIAVITVHPPRDDFHCSVFASEVVQKFNLKTILLPKTGTIVPEYKREFYLPAPNVKSHVITITDFTRKYLIDVYKIPKENITLIYQGTDLTSFNSSPGLKKRSEQNYKLPQDSFPVLGCIGSFEERKGQIHLIKAFAEVVKKFKNSRLLFVGDGPDENKLKNLVSGSSLEDNIIFYPFTREPNLVFARLDLLVLPSLYKEGLPNVLLEALAMGIPVIASKIAGIPEIVIDGETGYLTEPGNSDDLTKKIIHLCRNKKLLTEAGKKGMNLIHTKFDKKKQFREFLEFFKNISQV